MFFCNNNVPYSAAECARNAPAAQHETDQLKKGTTRTEQQTEKTNKQQTNQPKPTDKRHTVYRVQSHKKIDCLFVLVPVQC